MIPKTLELNNALPYFKDDELEYLSELGKNLPHDAVIVMLGIGPALAACALLEDAPSNAWEFAAYDIGLFPTAHAHLDSVGKASSVRFCLGDSAEAAEEWPNSSVDLLIIDADHSFEGVYRDIEAWYPKVRQGGTIFFHDFIKTPTDPGNGVAEAINAWDIYGALDFLEQPGISLVVEKI